MPYQELLEFKRTICEKRVFPSDALFEFKSSWLILSILNVLKYQNLKILCL